MKITLTKKLLQDCPTALRQKAEFEKSHNLDFIITSDSQLNSYHQVFLALKKRIKRTKNQQTLSILFNIKYQMVKEMKTYLNPSLVEVGSPEYVYINKKIAEINL